MGVPSVVPKSKIWGEKEEEWWDPQVGKQNRETAGANYVLEVQIFLLRPQLLYMGIKFTPCTELALSSLPVVPQFQSRCLPVSL
jgi:hypothetical protein